jgi:DNA-binding response OmpR family regulator
MLKARHSILLAEDDHQLGTLLTEYLQGEGFDVNLCRDGHSALSAFREQPFQLCLLDIMLPGMDGFTLAEQIRKNNPETPVIFLTARSMKEDKLKGYDLGADDYITKPFDADELVWKIKAVLRRKALSSINENSLLVSIGLYRFDFENQSLTIDGKVKRVTEKENEILRYLSDNRNKVIKREDLLKTLWGDDDYFLGRSLDVFITKIRKYLKDDPALSIENVFGVGFIFNAP